MASREKREEIRRANMQQIKEKEFRASLRKLRPFPVVSACLLGIALVLFSAHWLEIYNTDIPGVEISVSGFSAAICGLTGNYTMPDKIYGMMAAFYYWAPDPCPAFGATALASLVSLIAVIVLTVVIAVKDIHKLDAVTAALAVVSAALMIAAFVFANRMEPDMIAGYCSGNPACSLKSYAIFPALFTLAAAAMDIFASTKYFKARKTLE